MFCFSLQLIPRECFPGAPPAHVLPGGTRQPYFSMGQAVVGARREVSAPAAVPDALRDTLRLRALPRVGPSASRGQPRGSVAGRPPLAPGTGTPGGHTPPSAGPRCRGRVTRGGGGAALAPVEPSPPLSTCCSRASRVAAGGSSTKGRKTPNPSVRLVPSSLRDRHLSRSSPAFRPKVTITPPGQRVTLPASPPSWQG